MRIDRRALRRACRVAAAATTALALAATGVHGQQSRAATEAGARSAQGQSPDWLPPADHHMHVWSAEARDGLVRLISETREGEPPQLPTFDGDQAAAQLEAAGIERGVLLSTAYLFGSPDVDFADEREKVRRENDWVARQVAAHPDRLVAFFGVNPLADYAGDVARRCAEVDECTGIKLQLADSDVDLHDEAHVRALRSFFRTANELGLPVVVHLQTRDEDFGAAEVDVFVDRAPYLR